MEKKVCFCRLQFMPYKGKYIYFIQIRFNHASYSAVWMLYYAYVFVKIKWIVNNAIAQAWWKDRKCFTVIMLHVCCLSLHFRVTKCIMHKLCILHFTCPAAKITNNNFCFSLHYFFFFFYFFFSLHFWVTYLGNIFFLILIYYGNFCTNAFIRQIYLYK